MNTSLAQKTVNALVTDAEIGVGAKALVNATGAGVTETVIKALKQMMGGLWVGGTATLYETELAFQPNALNRAVHAGDHSVEIALSDINEVQVRFGFVTKIIDIVTDHRTLSIRCYGAPDFANTIRMQMAKLKDAGKHDSLPS